MSIYVLDIEADGPIPGEYSMILLGAVVLEPSLTNTFRGELRPISDKWVPEALKVSGYTREQTLQFDNPLKVMENFETWINSTNRDGRPVLISDNNGFDAMFITWYFWKFLNRSPFGYSSRRIGDIYAGMNHDFRRQNDWKDLKKTAHTHNPVDDARGNAEALLEFRKLGLKNL